MGMVSDFVLGSYVLSSKPKTKSDPGCVDPGCVADASGRRRSFSVNVAIGRYYCHGCHSHGNQLELWAAATKLPLYQAAIDVCHRLGCEVPWTGRC